MNLIHKEVPVLEAESTKMFTKVKAFHIENFKGIANLSAELEGRSCMFYSRQNGGKTCASEHAIKTLLQNFPGSKLRKGSDEGKLVFELEHPEGPAVVQITFDSRGNEETKLWLNGGSSPENRKSTLSFLKSLHSPAHDFEIGEIFRTKGQERAKAIIKMLGIDLDSEEKAYQEAFEGRKNVKRDLDSQRARIEIITPSQEALASKPPVDTSALASKLKEGTDWNNSIDRAKSEAEAYQKRLAELDAEQQELLRRLQECRNRISHGQTMLTEKQEWLKGKFKVSTEAIEKQIQEAGEENRRISEAKALADRNSREKKLLDGIQLTYDEADNTVKTARQKMYDKVNSHRHGVDGLSVTLSVETDKDGNETNRTMARATFNGLDFSDTEIAEGAIWAAALKIKASMLKDGQLGWFRMQANLLDNENILRLADEAERMGIALAYELNTQGNGTVQVTTEFDALLSKRL